MNNSIQLSFIIPVYNTENYIGRCIDSILNQNINNYEILLINDGSSDNSLTICEEYSKNNSKIKLYNKSNGGVSSARNHGLNYSLGKWIHFVDADDWILDNTYLTIYPFLFENDYDLIQFNAKRDDLEFTVKNIRFNNLADYHKQKYFQPAVWNYLFKRELILGNNIQFDAEQKYGEDFEFVMKYFVHTNKILCNDTIIYNYYQRENSAMNNINNIYLAKQNFSVIKKILNYVLPKKNNLSSKSFFNYNLYTLLKYTIHRLSKSEISKNELKYFQMEITEVFKSIKLLNYSSIRYLVLISAHVSLKSTLKISKFIWR